jgi:hypothetical protein
MIFLQTFFVLQPEDIGSAAYIFTLSLAFLYVFSVLYRSVLV